MKPLSLRLATQIQQLILIGGGEFSFGETRAIDELLLSRMPPDRRTIAFLPTASGSAEYATHLGKYFQSIDTTVDTVNVPIYRGRDSRRQRNLEQILSAGMVYLGGGVTNNLLDTMRGSPAELAIRDAASKGAVVVAIGAAASSFGTWARDSNRAGGALPGFGWLEGTAVETAFRPDDDVALRRLMSLPEVDLGLGIPAGTALAIDGTGSAAIIGDGTVAVFRKAGGEHR